MAAYIQLKMLEELGKNGRMDSDDFSEVNKFQTPVDQEFWLSLGLRAAYLECQKELFKIADLIRL